MELAIDVDNWRVVLSSARVAKKPDLTVRISRDGLLQVCEYLLESRGLRFLSYKGDESRALLERPAPRKVYRVISLLILNKGYISLVPEHGYPNIGHVAGNIAGSQLLGSATGELYWGPRGQAIATTTLWREQAGP